MQLNNERRSTAQKILSAQKVRQDYLVDLSISIEKHQETKNVKGGRMS